MDIKTFKILAGCARSIGLAVLCGGAITACGDGTSSVATDNAVASSTIAGKPVQNAVMTPKATNTFLAPIAASTANSSTAPAPALVADSITLSWAAPTENTDGSALTDLSGYEILYGTSASALSQKISIETMGVSNYVVENLGSGTWYFEVVAVNALGIESAPSGTVTITI